MWHTFPSKIAEKWQNNLHKYMGKYSIKSKKEEKFLTKKGKKFVFDKKR